MFKHSFLSLMLALGCAGGHAAAQTPQPSHQPTAGARTLLSRLLEMRVDRHWLADYEAIDWRSGDPLPNARVFRSRHTHCSAFAASACERLGIYLLRPPEHATTLLANAQFDWLASSDGRKAGWLPVVPSPGEGEFWAAQKLANDGEVVLATYHNRSSQKPGHIAIVRPSDWRRERVENDGPELMQAGGHNYLGTSLRQGFAGHPRALSHRLIRFYHHPMP